MYFSYLLQKKKTTATVSYFGVINLDKFTDFALIS